MKTLDRTSKPAILVSENTTKSVKLEKRLKPLKNEKKFRKMKRTEESDAATRSKYDLPFFSYLLECCLT